MFETDFVHDMSIYFAQPSVILPRYVPLDIPYTVVVIQLLHPWLYQSGWVNLFKDIHLEKHFVDLLAWNVAAFQVVP